PKMYQQTSSPRPAKEGLRVSAAKRRGASALINRPIAELPSRGGKGSRLKAASRRLREKRMLRKVANPSVQPAADAAATCAKRTETGGDKIPAAMPLRIATAAITNSTTFAAGPARAIQAARCG